VDGNSNKRHRRNNDKSIELIKTLFKFEESYAKVRVVKIEIQKGNFLKVIQMRKCHATFIMLN
jgi:hypothetical protein